MIVTLLVFNAGFVLGCMWRSGFLRVVPRADITQALRSRK